ncbi:MAG: ATP-binding protein [Spirochaetaceae bacterium]|jgi:predicted AAA+ superfamily ATPase|nr:ATP-binding protein [Spirochaetaceae bacterium]
MVERDIYLKKLRSFRDTEELIKVITGIRRCGKSSLLELYGGYLVNDGVRPKSVLKLNFEDLDTGKIDSAQKLHDYVKTRKARRGKTYVLLDEVQLVHEWERAVNSLRLDRSLDIYITGSNTYLLNSSLASLLSGRYVEIKMLPLSFSEFLAFSRVSKKENTAPYFEQYLWQGGFPGIFSIKRESSLFHDYLWGIYSTVVMKDIIRMNQVRDMDLMEKIIRFLADNIGYFVSAKKTADYLTSTGRKTTSDTVDAYFKFLENAYLFYRVRRNDLKGKGLLKTNDKFYIADPGLRNLLSGRQSDYGSVLENVVFLELMRRGYGVTVGKLDALEVDFVARRGEEKIYFQVSATMVPRELRERELLPLRKIQDNYPKMILSMDPPGPFGDFDGMVHRNLVDFLLEKDRSGLTRIKV